MQDKDKSEGRIDTFAKLLPGIGAIIAGIFIPLVIHINGERSRSNQLYAEIVSKREMADTELIQALPGTGRPTDYNTRKKRGIERRA